MSPGHGFWFKKPLYSLDSTVIDLCLSIFPSAKFRRTKGGLKGHVAMDHAGHLPAHDGGRTATGLDRVFSDAVRCIRQVCVRRRLWACERDAPAAFEAWVAVDLELVAQVLTGLQRRHAESPSSAARSCRCVDGLRPAGRCRAAAVLPAPVSACSRRAGGSHFAAAVRTKA